MRHLRAPRLYYTFEACHMPYAKITKTCAYCGRQFHTRQPKTKFCSTSCGKRASYPPLPDRFWQKVNKTDSCWLWTAHTNAWGYGVFNARKHTPQILAHRWAFLDKHGSIPDGLLVLHRCDTPNCVNPDHLFLGTHADNVADMMAKGRQMSEARPRGERVNTAKLDASLVLKIRSMDGTRASIARELNVDWGTIDRIKNGRTWRHVK